MIKIATPLSVTRGKRTVRGVRDAYGRLLADIGPTGITSFEEDVAIALLFTKSADLLALLRVALRADICPFCGDDNSDADSGGCFIHTSNGIVPHSGKAIALHDRIEK